MKHLASTHSIQHTAYNTQHTTHSIQHTAYNTQHTTYNTQHTTYSMSVYGDLFPTTVYTNSNADDHVVWMFL